MPSLNRRLLSYSTLIAFGLMSSACSQYQMKFNDAVVYTPPTIFTDFRVADVNLQQCLDQAIKDRQVTDPHSLKQLICSHAGVVDLSGIEIFTGLTAINISHNQITSLTALSQMSNLQTLLANDNQIEQSPELLTLHKLERIDLSNNLKLECGDLQQLQNDYQGDLVLPQQCQQ